MTSSIAALGIQEAIIGGVIVALDDKGRFPSDFAPSLRWSESGPSAICLKVADSSSSMETFAMIKILNLSHNFTTNHL
jgi:hypothetical protein